MKYLRSLLATIFAAFLSACGGGGREEESFYPPIPAGIPIVAGGFHGWWDVQPTPDGNMGIVNGTGNPIVSVTFTDADGDTQFDTNISPGAVWSSEAGFLPGFYLVTALGADGRVFKRYFNYDPSTGSEAAVVSAANWWLDI